jgi:hypothetical protein
VLELIRRVVIFFCVAIRPTQAADLWSSNIRFAVLSDANTGLFLVYNDTQGLGFERSIGLGRSLTVKYSQLFDLLN